MLFFKWQAPYNPEHTTAMVIFTRLTYMCTHGHTQTHIDRETNTDKETNRNWSGRLSCKKISMNMEALQYSQHIYSVSRSRRIR